MKREIVRCTYCDRVIPHNHWIKPAEEINPGTFHTVYWCYSCQKKFDVIVQGEMKHSWTADGYILVKIPGLGLVKEHTYNWEREHGKLPKGYAIHHINGDKADNRLENLIAIPKKSHSPHTTNRKNNIPEES